LHGQDAACCICGGIDVAWEGLEMSMIISVQEKLTAEKQQITEALEQRIRSLESGMGSEKQDLINQLQNAELKLEKCALFATTCKMYDIERLLVWKIFIFEVEVVYTSDLCAKTLTVSLRSKCLIWCNTFLWPLEAIWSDIVSVL
jgi:cupin superfamily acireductone dioxygenase involved in methionine salvage